MPLFDYKAVRRDGAVQQGQMEAADRAALIRTLQAQSYLPISAEPAGANEGADREPVMGQSLARALPTNSPQGPFGTASEGAIAGLWTRLRPDAQAPDLAFFRAMAPLLKAQLDVQQALRIVAELPGSPAAPAGAAMLRAVRRGDSLAEAMTAAPQVFHAYQIAVVRAGEATGRLAATMAELARYLGEANRLRQEFKSALIYPSILLATAVLSLLILLLWVLPDFQAFVETHGGAIAGPAQFLFWLSGVVQAHAGWVIVLLILAYLATRLPQLNAWYDIQITKLKHRLPLLGGLWRGVAAERFCRSLAFLLRGGVALPDAVSMAADTLTDKAIAAALRPVATGLREGASLSETLHRVYLLPQDAIALLEIGEQSGALAEMAQAAADLQAENLRLKLSQLLSWFTPALTLILGLLVGAMIVTVLETIFSVYDASLQ